MPASAETLDSSRHQLQGSWPKLDPGGDPASGEGISVKKQTFYEVRKASSVHTRRAGTSCLPGNTHHSTGERRGGGTECERERDLLRVREGD